MDYIVPVQIFTTLGAAINFGGSVLQSPLIMPSFQIHNVPTVYSAAGTAYILHNSEHFFPPLNALCTLGNLVLTIITFWTRSNSPTAAYKAPRLLTATLLSFATTAWALGIMVPMNKKMGTIAKQLEADANANGVDAKAKSSEIKHAEGEFRRLQNRWIKMNYGRAAIMIGASLAGMSALLG